MYNIFLLSFFLFLSYGLTLSKTKYILVSAVMKAPILDDDRKRQRIV